MKPTSLIEALQDTDMLEIDGLYAWQFDLDTELLAQISAGTAGSDSAARPLLQVHCIDGRERRLWTFSLASVQGARYSETDDSWLIEGNGVTHTLKCFAAYRGDNDEDDEEPDEA
ncbi:MAG: DUF5629 family protein [Pseudomonas sp.]|jgi:hypothetical protein|uniref:DUF5629 family protein n=1 Tax=Ectopseudomonas mendocina TaxID=300 RepID=UPI0023ED3D30|nr:DUF5629 family protein [Pseudomonas mendocina]